MRRFASCLVLAPAVFLLSTTAWPQQRKPMIVRPVDESQLVTLEGNTPPAALHAENDRGAVADAMRFDHLLLALKGSPESEARLAQLIEDMHRPGSPVYHHWLTPQQLGARFGLAPHDLQAVRSWIESHGFSVNRVYQHGLVIDFAGTAGQIRESFHTEIHNLVLPSGERHLAIVRDPQIPAALAPAIAGVASLHDFFPRRRSRVLGPVSFDHAANRWQPHFNVTIQGFTLNTVSPFDLATIYNVLPLWSRGFTGKGVTIALVEDSNLAHPGDWSTFRSAFDLNQFKAGNFKQVYPNCGNPGANGDEFEAALDVEWASATAPDANIELSACPNTQTTSGLDLAILNLLDFSPPDIISDSYGLCETITGNAEVALENREAQIASALGTTFFIAQGDTGADECAPFEPTPFSILGINSGDNTASAYAVDVGGTDFMAQYNSDVNGIPISKYWNATNNPKTLASARSYIPEIPWNDGCTSTIILSDPLFGDNPKSYGPTGFCNTPFGQKFIFAIAGSGGPSTCFTGKPRFPGEVSGSCKGNPKPSFQTGVPGIPQDGLRDQPDLSLFSANGVWGSFYVACMSDKNEGGTNCSAQNDAVFLGGGGTSFASPAMAGIQALIDQKNGRQGDANFVYYPLAAQQFKQQGTTACDASQTTGGLPARACIFNDVTRGDIDIPCAENDEGLSRNCFGAGTEGQIGELELPKSNGALA
ncbi:MAG TPA: protease pro-enzyme activation domain-containing protein, partial [Candidatus Sulfotelmatobacter sp.]|nr:protease pro-enzyme activation domain-containing protein [Candidatus Sulfotelmatobacter sp.]